MSDNRRWGFDEADDWEYESTRRTDAPAAEAVHALIGRDADGAVTVTVTPTAEVLAVKLAAGWRRSVDPRGLHFAVRSAANTATMQALARQVEQPQPVVPVQQVARQDETPITKEDALLLMAEVSADLARFTSAMGEVTNHPVVAESAGGHVRGSAKGGQVIELTIDPGWASGARESELESEVLEVLKALQSRGAPRELVNGPQSPAIAELTTLLTDPTTLLRRVGLLP